MKPIPYHHFKGKNLTSSEKIEREVVTLLLRSKIPDSKRESSIVFELKHASECIQVARILAQKRNLNIELAEVAAALHDMYVIVKGKYEDHGKLGAMLAAKMLKRIGGFSQKEQKIILDAIAHHSEKDVYSDNPYLELVKDADVFSCSYYKNSIEEYSRIKSAPLLAHYISRIKKVRRQLGLPEEPVFRS